MMPRVKATCDRIISDMAGHLLMEPAVDLRDHGACEARWRLQKMPTIAIQKFGPEAKALAQSELHQVAGAAGLMGATLAIPSVPMIGRQDGARVSGTSKGDRDVA